MLNEFQIGENLVEEESAAGKGMGERFTGGKEARRNEAAEEYAQSARNADKETETKE